MGQINKLQKKIIKLIVIFNLFVLVFIQMGAGYASASNLDEEVKELAVYETGYGYTENPTAAPDSAATKTSSFSDMLAQKPPENFSTYAINFRTKTDRSWTTEGKVFSAIFTGIGLILGGAIAGLTGGLSVVAIAGIVAATGVGAGVIAGTESAIIDYGNPSETNPCGNSSKFLGLFDFGEGAVCGVGLLLHDQSAIFLYNMVNFLADSVPEYKTGKVIVPQFAYGLSGSTTTLGRSLFNMDETFLSAPIQDELVDTNEGMGKLVRNVEKSVRTMVTFVFIIALMALAIINILQINISTYSVKKYLPGLIVGFIVSYFSFFAIRASLEVVGVVTKGVLSNPISTVNSTGKGQELGLYNYVAVLSSFPLSLEKIGYPCAYNHAYMTIGKGGDELEPSGLNGKPGIMCSADASVDWGKVTYIVLKTITMVVGGVMAFVLGFIFLLRRFVFYFLVPLAPLAILGAFFKPLDFIWQKWKKTFSGWLLMPLASSFWLWLALSWFKAYDPVSNYESGLNNAAQLLVAFSFGMTCLYMAIKTPFSMAGEASAVLNKWSSMGKKAWGSTGGAALKAGGNMIKSGAKALGTNIKEEAKYQMLEKTPVGIVARGMAEAKKNREDRRKGAMAGPVVRGQSKAAKNINNRFNKARLDIETKEDDKKTDMAINMAETRREYNQENKNKKKIDDIRERKGEAKRIEQSTIRRDTLRYLNGAGDLAVKNRRLAAEAMAINEEEIYKKKIDETNESWDTDRLAQLKILQKKYEESGDKLNEDDELLMKHLVKKNLKRQRDNEYSTLDSTDDYKAAADIVLNERMNITLEGENIKVVDGEMKKLKALTRMVKEMNSIDDATRNVAIDELNALADAIKEKYNNAGITDTSGLDEAISYLNRMRSVNKAERQEAYVNLKSTEFGQHLENIKTGVPIKEIGSESNTNNPTRQNNPSGNSSATPAQNSSSNPPNPPNNTPPSTNP